MLKRPLLRFTLQASPVQQAVGVKAVSYMGPLAKDEADGGTPLAEHTVVLRQLCIAHAVLVLQVLGGVGTAGFHGGIEPKRLEAQFDRDVRPDVLHRAFQRIQVHSTPGAGQVGDKVDAYFKGPLQ